MPNLAFYKKIREFRSRLQMTPMTGDEPVNSSYGYKNGVWIYVLSTVEPRLSEKETFRPLMRGHPLYSGQNGWSLYSEVPL